MMLGSGGVVSVGALSNVFTSSIYRTTERVLNVSNTLSNTIVLKKKKNNKININLIIKFQTVNELILPLNGF